MKKLTFPGDYAIITYLLLNSCLAVAFIRGFSLTQRGQFIFTYVFIAIMVAASVSIIRSSNRSLIVTASVVQAIVLFLLLAEPYSYYPFISPLGLIPLAILIFAIIKHKINGLTVGAIFFVGLFAGMLHLFVFFLSGFGVTTVLHGLRSPDGKQELVVSDSDQGALGGDVGINVERSYFFGLMKTRTLVYLGPWGDRPSAKWLSNTEVEINNQKLDIYSGKILESYQKEQ